MESNKLISLPLSPNALWTALSNQDKIKEEEFTVIDAVESYKNLSAKLSTYICNTRLHVSLGNVDRLSYDEKKDLFNDFLRCRSISVIPELSNEILNVGSLVKGIDLIPDDECLFTLEERIRWIKENSELSETIRCFLDSTLIYMARQTLSMDNVEDDLEKKFPLFDGDIPLNTVTALAMPQVMNYWHSVKPDAMMYFKKQFETPYFNGFHLDRWMSQDFNLLYGVVQLYIHNLL